MSLPLEIDCQSVAAKLAEKQDFVLLDCREQDEYKLVRIDGAELIPMSQLSGRAGELAQWRDRQMVVYCHHGSRSLQVALWLRKQGYEMAQSMAGGIDQWAQQIEPGMARY